MLASRDRRSIRALLVIVMPTETSEIETLANREYQWGFVTDIEADRRRRG